MKNKHGKHSLLMWDLFNHNGYITLYIESSMDSFTALRVSSVVNCVLFSFINMKGTVGLLSPRTVLEIEPKVYNPPKAIPFLRFPLYLELFVHLLNISRVLLVYTAQSMISAVHLSSQVHVLTD